MDLYAVVMPVVVAILVAACVLATLCRWRFSRTAAVVGFAILASLVLASQWTAAFDGYDSDLWTYVLIVERVAAGEFALGREPFLMEPPGSPQVSALWIALGFVQRVLGIPAVALVRGLSFVSSALLSWGAYRLGRCLFSAVQPSSSEPSSTGSSSTSLSPRSHYSSAAFTPPLAAVSVLLFWFALPETWAALALGRTLCIGFVLLAASEVLDEKQGRPRPHLLGVWIALAFYVHLFGGVLAAGAAGVALAARWARGKRSELPRVAAAGLFAAVLAAPSLAHAFATAGLARSSAHVWRPGRVTILGLSFLEPAELLAQISAPMLLMMIVGLAARVPAERAARAFGRIGVLVVALVFFTPLYGLATSLFGAWLVPRVALLAFPWVGATLAVVLLVGARERRWSVRQYVGAALALGLLTLVVLRPVVRALAELRGLSPDPPFSAEAQKEARSLRDRLKDRQFLSVDLMGYALAAPTFGRPLAVPPGHASPFGDFVRRQRRVHRALSTNTPECWAAFLALYPDVSSLVTPAATAVNERAVWSARMATSPEAVRERLQGMGVLEPVVAGRFFVVDALRPLPSSASVEGMGKGAQCRQ